MFDPLRKKEVASTPEEQVRQWFITQLLETFKVPVHMMMSETGFLFGGKRYRADILVYDRSAHPLAVVECKRPEVEISSVTARQAMRYNTVLDVRFIILTNGSRTYVFRREADSFKPMDHIPEYEEMTAYESRG